MVAMNDGTGLQYFLTDHLGSVVAITDATGTLINQQRYLPFGQVRTNVASPSVPSTDYGYTGQRKLDDGMGGLMDYKARFYSPYINHFIQPDSIVPNPANPQNLNRFGYVLNNPVNLVDPSGHEPKNGNGACYDITWGNACVNANGTLIKEGNGKGGAIKKTSNIIIGPKLEESIPDNVPANNTMHPVDIVLGNKNTFGSYVAVYSPENKIIGYRIASYKPNYSSVSIDWTAVNFGDFVKMGADNIIAGQLLKTMEIYGSKTMLALASKLNALSTVYDITSTANKLIVVDGVIYVNNDVVPVNNNLFLPGLEALPISTHPWTK